MSNGSRWRKVPADERVNFEQLPLVFHRSASQCIYIPGQVLNMYVPATVSQNGWKRKDSLANLIVCGSKLDTDLAGGH